MCSFLRLFLPLFMPSFICIFLYSLTHLLTHSGIRSYVHLSIQGPSIRLLVNLSLQSLLHSQAAAEEKAAASAKEGLGKRVKEAEASSQALAESVEELRLTLDRQRASAELRYPSQPHHHTHTSCTTLHDHIKLQHDAVHALLSSGIHHNFAITTTPAVPTMHDRVEV